MANPLAIAAALTRLVQITCPHCGYRKLVSRRVAAHKRACPQCGKQLTEVQSPRRR